MVRPSRDKVNFGSGLYAVFMFNESSFTMNFQLCFLSADDFAFRSFRYRDIERMIWLHNFKGFAVSKDPRMSSYPKLQGTNGFVFKHFIILTSPIFLKIV